MSTTFDGQPVLQVNDLAKAYGDKQAVNGLSFELHRGELLCLLGANGAGKTTTIEMCEGFIKPTSGRISVLGMDPTTQADDVRARVGIMLQGGGGYTGIKVKEMLKLAASYSAIRMIRIGSLTSLACAELPTTLIAGSLVVSNNA